MNQKWILILAILVFYQKLTSGADEYKVQEGQQVEINCQVSEGLTTWFRVLDNSNVEFIASFGSKGTVVKQPKKIFSHTKIKDNILILKSFTVHDSGVYTCACIKSNELKFGNITRLIGANHPKTVPAIPTTTTKPNLSTTPRACACNKSNGKVETSPDLHCTPIILGPLAGGCGLLLLLLIVTTLYCNQIRTRRCPHHHKRKPRTKAPGKQMMTNRHV